jgi:hypothetical protein
MNTGGFHRFMLAFADRKDFRSEMANQLIAHPQIDEMISHPSSVSTSIHSTDAGTFRLRAISALRDGTVSVIHGVANNLRVFGTRRTLMLLWFKLTEATPIQSRRAEQFTSSLTWEEFTELRQILKEAALSIHAGGDSAFRTELGFLALRFSVRHQ